MDIQRRNSHMKVQAEVEVILLQAKEPRIAGDYQELEEARKNHFWETQEEHSLSDTLNSDFKPPELYKNKFLLFSAPLPIWKIRML